jgi:hypothetical protein
MSILSSKEVILNIVGSINNETLSLDDYDVSDPRAVSDNHNTEVLIRPKIGSGLYGVRLLKYNRLNLAEFPNIYIKRRNAVTVRNLIPRIELIGTFGFILNISNNPTVEKLIYTGVSNDDIKDYYLPIQDINNNQIIPFKTSANSYIFYGETTLTLLDRMIVGPGGTLVTAGTEGTATVGGGGSSGAGSTGGGVGSSGGGGGSGGSGGATITPPVVQITGDPSIRTLENGLQRTLENSALRHIEYVIETNTDVIQTLQDNAIRIIEFTMI